MTTNFLRLVNIKNENIFNQARRNGLESYQPFSGKGRYRTAVSYTHLDVYKRQAIGCAMEAIMTYQILATKCLKVESMKVYEQLQKQDLPAARKAVSMLSLIHI